MKTIKPKITDFEFEQVSQGYRVTYTSPVTLKSWTRVITNRTLISKTIRSNNPRVYELQDLVRTIKF